jgi:hypothetical protein
MRKAIYFLLLCVPWALAPSAPAQNDGGFVVIVNDANPKQFMDRDLVRKLFLKQLADLPSHIDASRFHRERVQRDGRDRELDQKRRVLPKHEERVRRRVPERFGMDRVSARCHALEPELAVVGCHRGRMAVQLDRHVRERSARSALDHASLHDDLCLCHRRAARRGEDDQ